MKKLFLVLGLVAGTFAANAQISKGKIFLGGELGVNFGNTKGTSTVGGVTAEGKIETSNVTISPRIGYAIENNLVLGIAPTFGTANETHTFNGKDISDVTTQRFGGEIFARKYVPLVSFASFFAEAGAGYYGTSTKDNIATTNNKVKGKEFNIAVRPGISISVSSIMNLEFKYGSLGYDYSKPNNDVDVKSNNFGFNFNTESARVGVSFFLK